MNNLTIHGGSFDQNVVVGKPIKKRKIVKITNALGKLKQLQALQFRYKEDFDSDQRLRAGFSAQQVQLVIPEAVIEVDGYLMLDMNVLKAYMRQAKKDLKKINKTKVKL
tara:strand:+ start:417 stop:743 length:327 start_codon:yes stop_codon:yes gene_type:complete